ncbi:MAG: SidJ-related pseudokinase [Desulfosudaceae bacterium]
MTDTTLDGRSSGALPDGTVRFLTEDRRDFPAAYMAVAELQFMAEKTPGQVTAPVIRALAAVINGREHAGRRQAYFLYRKAAGTLRDIFLTGPHPGLAEKSRDALVRLLHETTGPPFRAAAEALGTIPLPPAAPAAEAPSPVESIPLLNWRELRRRSGVAAGARGQRLGRNLVFPLPADNRVLVVKTDADADKAPLLHREGWWMNRLGRCWPEWCRRRELFAIPRPIAVGDGYVFAVNRLPDGSGPGYGTAFITSPDYFSYPNAPVPSPSGTDPADLAAVLGRGALILGRLAAHGIVHTAPIPLFHNRVQHHRRNDRGLYHWPRGGRLDQWLASCRYPNIGATGVRDFEHFTGWAGSPRQLYEGLGTHILSLVLIGGSYFRGRDPGRVGRDAGGQPVDARDLFCPAAVGRMLRSIFFEYYRGFTGRKYDGPVPVDLERLTERLIEEMGVDRHMEEILRVTEQNEMSAEEFAAFLAGRGYSEADITRTEKGRADIVLETGPHLGAFNNRISLPELIEFTAAAAAVCVADRYSGLTG